MTPPYVHPAPDAPASGFPPEAERRRIDAAALPDGRALLVALGEALRFPDYYGANWDAFDECLRDLPDRTGAHEVVVELAGAERARERLGRELDTLAEVWADAAPRLADEGFELHLVLER